MYMYNVHAHMYDVARSFHAHECTCTCVYMYNNYARIEAYQPNHCYHGNICLWHVICCHLQRHQVIVTLQLRDNMAAVTPHHLDSYFTIVFCEQTTHRHLPPSQHTFSPHHSRGRSFNVHYIIVVVGLGSSSLVLVLTSIFILFQVSEERRLMQRIIESAQRDMECLTLYPHAGHFQCLVMGHVLSLHVH